MCCLLMLYFFFFTQKTSYELRISDWSSDVCSSDLQVRRDGGKPYAIPAGASDHPLGGLGYAHFADEVEQQERELGVFFDTIITATCTGSTQADRKISVKGKRV